LLLGRGLVTAGVTLHLTGPGIAAEVVACVASARIVPPPGNWPLCRVTRRG